MNAITIDTLNNARDLATTAANLIVAAENINNTNDVAALRKTANKLLDRSNELLDNETQ